LMPLPDEGTLIKIGEEIEQIETGNRISVENVVGSALDLPRKLLDQLLEVA